MTVDDSCQQQASIVICEPADLKLFEPSERGGLVARGEQHPHRLRQQPPGDEAERVRGRFVEPLRIVDHTQNRLAQGVFGEQVERGNPDDKAFGESPAVSPNALERASR